MGLRALARVYTYRRGIRTEKKDGSMFFHSGSGSVAMMCGTSVSLMPLAS
jgi:hypothetical protein